jgi:hypothetical protein
MKVMIIVALLSGATPVLAEAGKGRKAPDPNQRICKSVEVTGSRFAKSTCHTRAEWKAIDEASAGEADQAMRMRRADSAWPQ